MMSVRHLTNAGYLTNVHHQALGPRPGQWAARCYSCMNTMGRVRVATGAAAAAGPGLHGLLSRSFDCVKMQRPAPILMQILLLLRTCSVTHQSVHCQCLSLKSINIGQVPRFWQSCAHLSPSRLGEVMGQGNAIWQQDLLGCICSDAVGHS